MELLTQLDLAATNDFFKTFFNLPDFYWRGFLASSLSSGQLIVFAMLTMIKAPPSIQIKLMQHMITDPAGRYLLQTYAGRSLCAMLRFALLRKCDRCG
jgi:lycopene epsilon-cyclase